MKNAIYPKSNIKEHILYKCLFHRKGTKTQSI